MDKGMCERRKQIQVIVDEIDRCIQEKWKFLRQGLTKEVFSYIIHFI